MLTDPIEAHARTVFAELAIQPRRPVLIAVSGGGDSTALLHLFHRYARTRHPDVRIIAATVDHGLRPNSAAEARHVATMCRALGIAHCTLRWDAESTRTALQARARAARYPLLARLAEEKRASLVLTGHTADDQAETVAMRKARSGDDGGIGLAGIDPATLHARTVWFARPLLGQSRDALRTWLKHQDIAFADDPSNADRRFERVRVRQRLAGNPAERDRMLTIAQTHAAARRNRAIIAARCINDRRVWRRIDTIASFDPAGQAHHDQAAHRAAMSGVLTWTGRLAHQPGDEQVGAALEFCRDADNGQAFTIAGCVLRKAQGIVHVTRESRNRRPAHAMAFGHLLVSADWPLAQALAALHDAPPFPAPPFTKTDTMMVQ